MENINFEELSPELQAYIDQERTKASKSAYANAEKKLRKDTNFINDIRSAIEEEARLTGEEKLAKERELFLEEQRYFKRQRNLFQVEAHLSKAGFDNEQIEKFSKFLVSEDEEATINHVNDFLTTYRSTFEQQLAEQKKQLLKATPTPQTGTSVGREDHYKAEYERARNSGDATYMARIIREAAQHNIQL